MRRRVEEHEGEHLAQVVLAAAEIAQLLDQVKEGEQSEKADQHEAHGAVDLAREVALEGAWSHGSALASEPQPNELHALREEHHQQHHHAGVHDPPASRLE